MNEAEPPPETIIQGIERTLPAPALVLSADGTIVEALADGSAESPLVASDSTVTGTDVRTLISADTADDLVSAAERALETDEALRQEITLPDGDRDRHYSCHIAPLPGEGKADRVAVLPVEVTERKERTGELERHEEFLERVRDVVTVVEADGTIVYESPAVRRLHGYGPTERVGDDIFDFVHPEDRERVKSRFDRPRDGTPNALSVEYRARNADGTWTWVETRGHLDFEDPKTDGIVFTTMDISRRKARERDSKLFRQLIDESLDSVFVADPESGQILDVNETACKRLGYDRPTLLGKYIWNVNPTLDGPKAYSGHDYGDSADASLIRTRHERADGSTFPVETSVSDVECGGQTYRVIVARDITERVEYRKKQQREREHLARTEELAQTGGWEYLPDTETLRWTEGTRRIFDVDEDFEPTVATAIDFYHPADQEEIEAAFERCLETGEPYSLEARIISESGRQRWVRTRGERTDENGRRKLIGVIQDITRHKTDQQRLMVVNRVLRHNLRNELTAVQGYAELIGEELTLDSQEYFEGIVDSAENLICLAEKFQRFRQVIDYDSSTGTVELKPLLESLAAEYRTSSPEVTIETDLLESVVPGNEAGLRILFEELFENAIEHNDSEGATVRVKAWETTERRVAVRVEDDGPGLPETEVAVLRDGEETGLLHSDGMGLWIVNWIVTILSGGISVERTGDGTAITVRLPTASPTDVE